MAGWLQKGLASLSPAEAGYLRVWLAPMFGGEFTAASRIGRLPPAPRVPGSFQAGSFGSWSACRPGLPARCASAAAG